MTSSSMSKALFALCLFLPASALASAQLASHAGWISIMPPLIAIALALWFKQVIPALFAGVWMGAWAINGGNLKALWTGLLDTFQVYILGALANPDHAAIVLFSLMVGGMVGIISRNGGMHGIVKRIINWVDSARHATIATYILGFSIFFDDYANTLVVGNTMRPVADRMRVSRAKLAYIVDSTAAPIAAVAIVTTWIGAEVAYIGDALSQTGYATESAYMLFLRTIPYSFYPLLTLLFVGMIAFNRRDFGPMLRAEIAALDQTPAKLASVKSEDLINPLANKPQRAINAVIPVLVLVGSLIAGLIATGEGDTLKDIIGSSNSYTALMWASLLGVVAATILSIGQKILSLEQVVESWVSGAKVIMLAMIILILAWALGKTTESLNTASYLISIMGDSFPLWLLPTLVFVLAAATAFATGSSWGTMGILMPLVVPLSFALLHNNGVSHAIDSSILVATIAGVLGGAVWGDHCSPISDTTILSSMATGCNHIEHVRTQLPYALLVGGVAIAAGTIPAGFGVQWWLSLLVGSILLIIIYRVFTKPVE